MGTGIKKVDENTEAELVERFETAVDEVFQKLVDEYGVTSGDISPEQYCLKESSQEQLAVVALAWIKQNLADEESE